jgi:hypothetical protein
MTFIGRMWQCRSLGSFLAEGVVLILEIFLVQTHDITPVF